MRHLASVLSFALAVFSFRDAFAQDFFYVPPGGYGYGIDLGSGFGYGYGFGYGLADSPDTVAANALSDFVRSHGPSQVVPPQTSVENDVLSDDIAPDWLTLAAEKRAKQLALKQQRVQATKEAIARQREQQNSHPELRSPARLTHEQFDPSTGKVSWPAVLLRDSFSVQRTEVESLLKTRAHAEGKTETNALVAHKVQEMVRELRSQIHLVKAREYLEGQRFLTRLDRETR